MGTWLSEREQRLVAGAEAASAATPIPTQIVSNGEYLPPPQSATQKRVEARINELADTNGKRLGLNRRQFMRTSCGMAAAFVAMNEIYGNVFQVTPAEAREPELVQARAQSLAGQFIFDVQTHFVRDDFDHKELLGLAEFASQHWNPKMKAEGVSSLARYKFQNYVKEIYYDSDTNLALLSGAPFDDPTWWFLSNEQIVKARELINDFAGSRRLLAHSVITPKQPGWMDEVDKAIAVYKPNSWKGYTIGDPLNPSKFPWRLDDEKLMYPFYEKAVKAGITTICIHKGLLPPDYEKAYRRRVGVRNRVGHRQGRQGLAADELRDVSRLPASGLRAAGPGVDGVRADRAHPLGHATWRRSRRSSASPTSMPSSARPSPTRRWRIRSSAPRWSAR